MSRYPTANRIFLGAWCCILVLLQNSLGLSAVYEVNPNSPIQDLVNNLQAGDTLNFSPGEYTTPVLIQSKGFSTKPIRIKGGRDVVFNGLAKINTEWTEVQDGIYQATVTQPVRQLFVNGELMTPARWPNMTFAQRWDNSKWPAADTGAHYGKMVDADLASAGIDFTGCVATLNIGSWQTFRRMITKHAAGQDHFEYPTDAHSRLHNAKHPAGMDRYCIYGKAALDTPGEWYYDADSSTLLLYPPANKSPDDFTIESKRMSDALVLQDAHHVHVSGFRFRGTTVRMENVHHCTLENIAIEYGSTVANPFGPNLQHPAVTSKRWNARKWFGETSVDTLTEVTGDDNVLRNIRVRYSEGPGLTVAGKRNLIENCLIQEIDWHGLDYGYGIDLLAATPVTVRRVTLDHCGGSEGLRLANHGPSLVEHCHLHHCGLRQSDGAIIQVSTAGATGTEIRFNWIHDHNAFHWGGNGIRGDDQSRGLAIHHNVIWNCREKGIVTKGDQHRVYHNSCFNNPKIDILIPRNRLPGKPKELAMQNRRTEVYNNLGAVTGSWFWEKRKLPPLGKHSNNQAAENHFFRDVVTQDFRLKPNAPPVDAGKVIKGISEKHQGTRPDLGAHEADASHWKAGYEVP